MWHLNSFILPRKLKTQWWWSSDYFFLLRQDLRNYCTTFYCCYSILFFEKKNESEYFSYSFSQWKLPRCEFTAYNCHLNIEILHFFSIIRHEYVTSTLICCPILCHVFSSKSSFPSPVKIWSIFPSFVRCFMILISRIVNYFSFFSFYMLVMRGLFLS